jgi:N-formylglutamate amidohydrolase
MNALLLHIPHSSTAIPAHVRDDIVLEDLELERELLQMTDWYTDELFSPTFDHDRIVYPLSRLVVDPERFAFDDEEPMSRLGMGVFYEKTNDGRKLRIDFDRQALMNEFYYPHHQRLNEWVTGALRQHERVLIVDCHSYPSEPMPCDWSKATPRPHCCIGTDSFHTPDDLADLCRQALASLGWTVGVNDPYRGTLTPSAD